MYGGDDYTSLRNANIPIPMSTLIALKRVCPKVAAPCGLIRNALELFRLAFIPLDRFLRLIPGDLRGNGTASGGDDPYKASSSSTIAPCN